jgi:hypothetical protein
MHAKIVGGATERCQAITHHEDQSGTALDRVKGSAVAAQALWQAAQETIFIYKAKVSL